MERYEYNTVVVGTGAAGWNAADSLVRLGQSDICIVTEHKNAGTSRNTGSDKQTYYKLTLSGLDGDSVGEMAKTLFSGGCVDGDLALCEAALSAKSFYKLVELGVPFPKNRYGEYIGYKTDHDPRRRATSAGPYTSKMMTECLEQAVSEKHVPVFDGYQVIRILVRDEQIYGILCLNLKAVREGRMEFAEFFCKNIVFAVGGPGGIYADSVYPKGHYGSSGIALEAGVKGRNLTEWQYGLASVRPRWNVSGTYMQVLPRVYSTNEDGSDEREFLFDAFQSEGELLSNLFLKGYQWPFDVKKAREGSSKIDLLVYLETLKGRKIFLDYTKNPLKKEYLDFEKLNEEAKTYLKQAGACFGKPIDRLLHMNQPAVAFYRDRGVDLEKEPLEIALCAQHNNGGLAVDCWWQTNVKGFFAVGEVSGTHGVARPGGSALNAGQVGSYRAAEWIAEKETGKWSDEQSLEELEELFCAEVDEMKALLHRSFEKIGNSEDTKQESKEIKESKKLKESKEFKKFEEFEVTVFWERAVRRMSAVAAAVRTQEGLTQAIRETELELQSFSEQVYAEKWTDIWKVFRLRDILISQFVYMKAMQDYIEHGGKSRGSALYADKDGVLPMEGMPEFLRFSLDNDQLSGQIQEVLYRDGECAFTWRKVRQIPLEDDFFENVWRQYRENKSIAK